MKRILLPFFLFSFFTGNAQVSEGYDSQMNLLDIGKESYMGVIRTYNHAYEGIKGSPLLFNDWKKGRVILTTGKIYNDIKIKYDVYENELIALSERGAIYIDRNIIRSFELKDTENSATYLFKKVDYSNELKQIKKSEFFRILYEGNSMLLEKREKIFLKADYTGAYNAGRRYDEFRDKEELYIKLSDNKLYELKPKMNKLLKVLQHNKKEVKNYITENGLDVKNTDHLILILQYYDQITNS